LAPSRSRQKDASLIHDLKKTVSLEVTFPFFIGLKSDFAVEITISIVKRNDVPGENDAVVATFFILNDVLHFSIILERKDLLTNRIYVLGWHIFLKNGE